MKIHIDSTNWKCPQNLIICSRLHRFVLANGHDISHDPKTSDYIILSSCGGVNLDIKKTLNILQCYTDIKDSHTVIIVFGCLPDIDHEALRNLDVISIGFGEIQKLDSLFYQNVHFRDIDRYCEDSYKEKIIDSSQTLDEDQTESLKTKVSRFHPFFFSIPLIVLSSKAKQRYNQIHDRFILNDFVEISKGCTNNCNYCSIKKAKGSLESRNIPDIINDIKRVYSPSKALSLVADDCGCYGVDRRLSIIHLLDAIHEKFPEVRLRLNYLDPMYLTKYRQDFLRVFQTMHIASVTIPLQTGSQKILAKMNRHYDIGEALATCKKIKEISPSTIIVAHFIIGHPGETWRDYWRSLAASRFFDNPIPLSYSRNKNTVSATMANQISKHIRSFRYAIFILFLNVVVLFRIVGTIKQKVTPSQ
jgi:tRNA A37 methylthiotransferase MiaB